MKVTEDMVYDLQCIGMLDLVNRDGPDQLGFSLVPSRVSIYLDSMEYTDAKLYHQLTSLFQAMACGNVWIDVETLEIKTRGINLTAEDEQTLMDALEDLASTAGDKLLWYAVQSDVNDALDDGSFDLAEAVARAKELLADGREDVLIAVIDANYTAKGYPTSDWLCVDEIRDF